MRYAIAYIVAVLVANYTATWFVPLPVFGMVAVGTLVFGVTFTMRDHVHRQGRQAVYVMIAIAAILSVVESAVIGVPGRIIAASFIAIVLSEIADTEVYHRLLTRSWLVRVMGSNAVSVPLDTIVFNTLAFAGVFPVAVLVSLTLGEIIVKFATGGIAALWKSSTAPTATGALLKSP
jgi:queuosine precursor transporter